MAGAEGAGAMGKRLVFEPLDTPAFASPMLPLPFGGVMLISSLDGRGECSDDGGSSLRGDMTGLPLPPESGVCGV